MLHYVDSHDSVSPFRFVIVRDSYSGQGCGPKPVSRPVDSHDSVSPFRFVIVRDSYRSLSRRWPLIPTVHTNRLIKQVLFLDCRWFGFFVPGMVKP